MMTRTFNKIWYTGKTVSRKGRSYFQWFKCKAPAASVGYLGELVACDDHQKAAMEDVRRSRRLARDAAGLNAEPQVQRFAGNVISVEDAEVLAMQQQARLDAPAMARLVDYIDGGLGAELARLENEGGYPGEETHVYDGQADADLVAAVCKPAEEREHAEIMATLPAHETIVFVLTPEQILAAEKPETRKVTDLSAYRQRVFEDAMNH